MRLVVIVAQETAITAHGLTARSRYSAYACASHSALHRALVFSRRDLTPSKQLNDSKAFQEQAHC
jgi:hypothetical protein